MIKHLNSRAAHHRSRAEHYKNELARLTSDTDNGSEEDEQLGYFSSSKIDQLQSNIRTNIRTHNIKAAKFAWCAEHVDSLISLIHIDETWEFWS